LFVGALAKIASQRGMVRFDQRRRKKKYVPMKARRGRKFAGEQKKMKIKGEGGGAGATI